MKKMDSNIYADKSNNIDLNEIKKNSLHSSYYSNIGTLLGIILFFILTLIKEGIFNIQLVSVFMAGQAVTGLYKYKQTKKKKDLFLGSVCIVVVLAGVILYL